MIIDGNKITAEDSKILRRKSDKKVVGNIYYCGYIYSLNNKKLDIPILEKPEDFEELTQEECDRQYEERKQKYPSLVESYIREKYSVADELAIQRQKDTKKEDFNTYFKYCEDCKYRAKIDLKILE